MLVEGVFKIERAKRVLVEGVQDREGEAGVG
jgi:hypothetical protein